ncbi:hypothetical protein FRB96_007667 [Tulasnella sp. 330]|nr:hypothetical protein FRB96_007667 [Tulasnella sp. 330]KAG8880747.1 hypothetical protein FRB97_000540 [Tulasnella sp. 331]KAG8889635.1 hypothetical protein FRB98_003438 [Tulasnella sp. 332]
MSLDSKLVSLSSLSQKDKGAAYADLLKQITASSQPSPADIGKLVNNVVSEDHVGLVVARQVLGELLKALDEEPLKSNMELQKKVIEISLENIQRSVSFQEQASALRLKLADILESEEDWSEAAKVLMGLNYDTGRLADDDQKLRIYVRIVRLLLEEEDSVQAETYQNRAGLLIHSTKDRELQLSYKLCQARIYDYARRFVEAALRYHELSWVGDLDEDERLQILAAAITCAVLAPAGPNRSRILASLYRDERTLNLPNYTILSKMFNEHILRPQEVKGFEETLKPHQLARIAQSANDRVAVSDEDVVVAEAGETVSTRTGPSTVLDRAVMEHNLLSCSKIYNNITFSGLGALLDLTSSAAETMARRMIEQGRLRASIDQVERLITFEVRDDVEAQGNAGGLGDVNLETEDTGAPFTKKWDLQIRRTAANVEGLVQTLHEKGLISSHQVAMAI